MIQKMEEIKFPILSRVVKNYQTDGVMLTCSFITLEIRNKNPK